MLSKEQRLNAMLLYLSNQREYTTADTIAEELGSSVKTVYRLIKKVNNDFKNGDIIYAKKGRGYKLDSEKYVTIGNVSRHNACDFSPIERRNNIMEELLLQSPKPISIDSLFEKYYVSDTVISNDEKIISDILGKYDLLYKRKNRQVRILGNEKNIRKAINNIIITTRAIDVEELKSNKDLSLNNHDVTFVLEQLKLIEKKLDTEIPHPYHINIFSHLYILIGRARKSGNLLYDASDFSVKNVDQYTMQNQSIYSIAEIVIGNVEKYISIKLPKEEIYNLFQYLLSSRMKGNSEEISVINPLVKEVTDVYLEHVGNMLGITKNTKEFQLDLSRHIKPMINRLQNNISIKNTLLESIKLEYGTVFNKVKSVSEIVSQQFSLPTINDDENGFLTLYFARILEQNPKTIKTLIMCTTGVGTSELLKVKVKKKFPELDILSVTSSRGIWKKLKDYPDTELVLTTVNLSQELHISTILVSAMFTILDQERVHNYIEEYRNER